MRDWREPFFIAGEVILIRQRTGDWTAKLHEETRGELRQAAVRIGTPESSCLLTTASVAKFLASQLPTYGARFESQYFRKFVYGWHWREPESDFEPWTRIETDDLRAYEERDLYAILRRYSPTRTRLKEQRSEAGRKGAEVKWAKG